MKEKNIHFCIPLCLYQNNTRYIKVGFYAFVLTLYLVEVKL